MAYFNNIEDCTIVFHQHLIKKDKPIVRTCALTSDGELRAIVFKKERNIKDCSTDHLWKVFRGQVYVIYNGMRQYVDVPKPIVAKPANENEYFEVYAYGSDGESLFVNEEATEAIPVYVSIPSQVFLDGYDLRDLLFDHDDGEIEPLFGKDVLEAIFDIEIPKGFEAMALSELQYAIDASEDDKLAEDGKRFISWLIEGKGLPAWTDELRAYLGEKSELLRRHMNRNCRNYTVESAIVEGCKYLRGIKQNEALFPYLRNLADKGSALAAYKYACYCNKDGILPDALVYAIKAASQGCGPACLLAAEIYKNRGLFAETRMYLEMGMEANEPDAFYHMARLIMATIGDEDNPFDCDDPVKVALGYADRGRILHSAKSMVILADLLLAYYSEQGHGYALQLLKRAESLGEKNALYPLARYYLFNHELSEGQNLPLAELYIKKAIIEDAYDLADCQILYAGIHFAKGTSEFGLSFLDDLAAHGNFEAQSFLGQIAVGAYEYYSMADEPIPDAYLKKLKNPKEFYVAALWRIRPEIVSPKKAIALLSEMAEKGEGVAYYELAKIYRDGPDCIKDSAKAEDFEKRFSKYLTEIPQSAERTMQKKD